MKDHFEQSNKCLDVLKRIHKITGDKYNQYFHPGEENLEDWDISIGKMLKGM